MIARRANGADPACAICAGTGQAPASTGGHGVTTALCCCTSEQSTCPVNCGGEDCGCVICPECDGAKVAEYAYAHLKGATRVESCQTCSGDGFVEDEALAAVKTAQRARAEYESASWSPAQAVAS